MAPRPTAATATHTISTGQAARPDIRTVTDSTATSSPATASPARTRTGKTATVTAAMTRMVTARTVTATGLATALRVTALGRTRATATVLTHGQPPEAGYGQAGSLWHHRELSAARSALAGRIRVRPLTKALRPAISGRRCTRARTATPPAGTPRPRKHQRILGTFARDDAGFTDRQ